MKKLSSLTAATLLLAVGLTGCNQSQEVTNPVEQTAVASQARIQAHIEFLADDTLRGRDTGSEGYQIAANYVKAHFTQYGLTPMGDHDGFEQPVTFRKSLLVDNSATFSLNNGEGEMELAFPEQFFSRGSSLATESSVTAETVFVGYGIVDKAFDLDDYAGLDVKGKVVVMLTGRPESLPSEEGAHISREKARFAAEKGAVGIITLHTPKREKVRAYSTSAKYASAASYSWLDKNGQPFGKHPELKVGAYVNHESAQHLFVGAQRTAEEIFNDDSNNADIKGFPLKATVTLAAKNEHQETTSPNIVAAIEGSDPTLKNEYVVFTAHLDHVGVSTHGDHEDKINNGALDNASGVSILLETARILSSRQEKPKRSILFTVVTAEERGLLGSSYYANNPTVPETQMVANVNLDMPVILYPFADVIAFGATHSTLGPIVEKAAGKIDISLSPDPMPEQAIFTRSDHYSFVKRGIPSVFLMTGFKSTDPEIDGGKVFGEFLSTHYHQHSDEISLPINYDAAQKFAEVNIMIGLEIANQAEKPRWNEGDYFGNTFAK